MKILLINAHLTYPGWSEGKLNLTFMKRAKAIFVERGYEVIETFVERGYDSHEEVNKHLARRPGRPPDPGKLVWCAVDL
jgi:modulator of drug activity B